MQNRWIEFYFSFKGRVSRRAFNVNYGLTLLIGSILAAIVDFQIAGGDILAASQSSPVSSFWNILVIWPTLAIIAKRLQDLNIAGYWQIPVLAPVVFIYYSVFGSFDLSDPTALDLGNMNILLFLLSFFLIFLIFLSTKSGTRGPNKYGPDPLQVNA